MGSPVRFGHFWLHEIIGRGGMADVYRASTGADPYQYSVDVALKRMREPLSQDSAHVEQFLLEDYVQRELHHPNIVRSYESGLVGSSPYIAMEYIKGADLESLLGRATLRHLPVPIDVAIRIALELLKALDFAHRATTRDGGVALNLIHRDVSPANVYLGFDGRVKLGDFGVARVDGMSPEAHRGMIKGKVAYIPQEVLAGTAAPSQHDDLWALAVCFYEMVTLDRLYGDASEEEILERVGAGKLPLTNVPGLHRPLKRLLQTLLNPKPGKRPRDAAAFYRELKSFATREKLELSRENTARYCLALLGNVDVLASQSEGAVRCQVTGAATERYLHERLQVELDRSRRYGRVVSILSLNVDNFSRVNTLGGQAQGDALLSTIVRRFLPKIVHLRSCDLVARRNADHFTLMLPETPVAGTAALAKRILGAFAKEDWSIDVPGMRDPLTASIGISGFPDHGRTVGELLRGADDALREAKGRGGNTSVVSTSLDPTLISQKFVVTASEDRLAWEMRIPSGSEARRTATIAFPSNHELLQAYADDIPGGGLRVATDNDLEVDSLVTLELTLPEDKLPLRVGARVCWVGSRGMKGFQFLEPTPRLKRMVESLQWEQLNASSESTGPAISERS